MKRLQGFRVLLIPALAIAISALIAAPASAFVSTLVVDDDGFASAVACSASDAAYTSIQDAIDAASSGQTIKVCPGTYDDDDQILVDKALTIQGADRDTTIIDGGGATLADAGTVDIDTPPSETGDVIFSGFTIQNAGLFGGVPIAMFSKPESASSTHTISDILIQGGANSDYGFWTYRPLGTVILRDSTIQNTGDSAVLIEQPLGPTSVINNTLEPNGCCAAYYNFTYGGDDAPGRQLVKDNIVDAATGGISFYTAVPFASGEGMFMNVDVIHNTITNVGASYGIRLRNGASGDGSGGEIVAPLVLDNTVRDSGLVGSIGLRIAGFVSDALITGNSFSNLDTAILGEAQGSHVPTGAEARNNSFVNNALGVVWNTADDLDAVHNWWGDPSGPSGVGYGDGDSVTTNVTYEPWCFNAACTLYATGGTDGAETLYGTSGADIIYGFGGADVIKGLSGADRLFGGAGADMLYGGRGADSLFGGPGGDALNGGRGADSCSGGPGSDTFTSC